MYDSIPNHQTGHKNPDAESLLTDEYRLFSLSVSHKKYLREKLRRAIIRVRSILQEAVAYDSSQLFFSTSELSEQCKAFYYYFDSSQSNLPDLSRLSLDNKEKPEAIDADTDLFPNLASPSSENVELAFKGTTSPRLT